MYQYIMVRYGEIGTKGKNKKQFINRLHKNIKDTLKAVKEVKVINHYERIYIELNGVDHLIVYPYLEFIAGIASYSPVMFVEKDLEIAKEKALELVKSTDANTFKVDTRRADKSFEVASMEVNKIIASHILKNMEIKVDVHNPDVKLELEIRDEGIYIFSERIKGLGGFPLGMGGKALLMLSGGIDSPVAGFEVMRRGVEIEAIHFASPPYTSTLSDEKVYDIAKKLNIIQSNIKLHMVNFTKIQETIYDNVDESYAITLMRRMMFRIADKVAKKNNNLAIVSGESIGQVASQTLESMVVINEVTNYPIIRPLATKDKQEVITTAKKIDTYEISIRPFEDCCTIFTPKNPVTKPSLKKAQEYEAKFEFESLIDDAIENIKVIKINKDSDEDEIF